MDRVTECEAGPIVHREETRLVRRGRCPVGHDAPEYASARRCVVCAKLSSLGSAPDAAASLHRFADYGAARRDHWERGGYLLDLGGGTYGTTDDSRVVRRLRGAAWLRHCELVHCWDEIEIAGFAGSAGKA